MTANAAATVNALRTGDQFLLRGRRFTVARETGWSFYYDGPRGDYVTLPVWNASHRQVRVTVRPGSKITVLAQAQS